MRLSSVTAERGRCGSAPGSFVKYAKKQCPDYGEVWCVFDRNQHPEFAGSLSSVRDHKKLKEAASCPCFELWYLLHFAYTTRHFQTKDELVRELAQQDLAIENLLTKIGGAKENAQCLRRENSESGAGEAASWTSVDLLVQRLEGIRDM